MSIYLYVIQACMSGPVGVSGPGHTLAAVCQGLHPLPVMFQAVLELEPGVRSVIRLSSSACDHPHYICTQIPAESAHGGEERRLRGLGGGDLSKSRAP